MKGVQSPFDFCSRGGGGVSGGRKLPRKSQGIPRRSMSKSAEMITKIILTVEQWVVLTVDSLNRITAFSGLTVDTREVLAQSANGFTDLPTFAAWKERQIHGCY